MKRRRHHRPHRPRINGLATLLALQDPPHLDDDDDCPLCRELAASEGISSGTFDAGGNMVALELTTRGPKVKARLKLDDGEPLAVSMPDGATYRGLIDLVAGWVGVEVLNAPLTVDDAPVLLDERVRAGSLVRIVRPQC